MLQYSIQFPVTSKTCPDCNECKPTSAFNKNKARADKLQGVCRSCQAARAAHPQSRQSMMARYQETKDKNRERNRAYGRKYVATHSDKMKADVNAARKQRPDIYKAKGAVSSRIGRGLMPPAKDCFCFVCGTSADQGAKMHYHHTDYSKPLDVFPVCAVCHYHLHHP